jgi:hypothetical protein
VQEAHDETPLFGVGRALRVTIGHEMFTRRSLLIAAILVAISMGTSGRVRADIYTYTDANGVTHISNRPPGGRRTGVRQVRTSDRAPRPSPSVPSDIPDGARNWDSHIREAAALYRLPEPFIRAVIRVESGGNPAVVSPVGACGLMQLMPGTAARMGVTDIFDPRQNILGGTRYLRVLANLFNGDLILTIAAYNAGEAAVLRYRGIPPYDETQRYVRRVLGFYYGFLEVTSRPDMRTASR